MHTYLYLRECLKLKKNVLNIFFIVYISKFELGFWKIMWKFKGSIQVIKVQDLPSTLSEC